MSVETIGTPANPEPDRNTGIYALPVVGKPLQQAREATEGLRPTESDSAPQVVAKRVAQGAIITGAAAITAVVIL